MKYSGIGGQAVIEGVMMRNKNQCAVAVRKPDKTIEVKTETVTSARDKYAIARWPIIRGMVSFVESLSTGMKTLNFSASFYEEEEEKKMTEEEKKKSETKESILTTLVMILSFVIAIGIFVLLPYAVSEFLLKRWIKSAPLLGLIEGVFRVMLFVLYVKLISLMEDIRRVFMYHGAEHKCISCVETGKDLTVENARTSSIVHKRCGTSFLLFVMFVSILFFMFITVENVWLRMGLRIILIPVIAGVAFEFIRYAGNHDNLFVRIFSKPGLWLQGMTTKEPTDDMLEVAIASVEAVFDWKEFLGKDKEKEIETIPLDEEEDQEVQEALDRYLGQEEAQEEKES